MSYKTIIFDLDGTLLNSLEDIKNSMNAVLTKNNLQTHNSEKYQYFIGEGIKLLVQRSLPTEFQNPIDVSKFHDQFKSEYKKRCLDYTKPYDKISDVLSQLNKRNIPISIISNKSDELTKYIVPILFPNVQFKYIIGQRENGTRKPDPASALEISNDLKIDPSHFLFIGDSTIDIETAKNAGMRSIAVSWGFRTVNELKDASQIIYSPAEILTLD